MDSKEVWKKTLLILKDFIKEQTFNTWLEPTEGVSLKGNTLQVDVPNQFFIDWIEDHYRSDIYEALKSVVGEDIKIRYHSLGKGMETIKAYTPPIKLYTEDASHLQGRYTFDTFVVGEGNKFAHAASLAVANLPGKKYNPLFVYGTVGLGKTHLIQAIGNYLKDKEKGLKVYYTSCEQFMNELIDSIQNSKTLQLRKKYRNKDVLLIDDIHFLEKSETLQEEMFHTFNALYEEGRQIVFTSDRPPTAFSSLEERLVSRFQSGLVCDIKPPSLETRVAILKNKLEVLKGPPIPDNVLLFIAERIKSNIRELEGALIKILAQSSIIGVEITIESCNEFLKDMLTKKEEDIKPEQIQKIIASYYNITLSALRGKRRVKQVVFPRQIAIYLIRELTSLTFKQIGDLFGGRDHATIIHDFNKIKILIEKNTNIKEEVITIEKRIKSE